MPAKLGEMLLKAGALNEAQLERVLDAQAVYGGRLGTNLVEMGLVGEDQLASLLNEKLGVPYLDAAALDSVPDELLGVIPLDMMRRHRVLPVALDGERLLVAMADPTDLKAIEEIGFVTGFTVAPRLCTELRLSVALERYCGIHRSVRYISSAGEQGARLAGMAGSEKAGADSGAAEARPGGAPSEGAAAGPASRMDRVGNRLSVEAVAARLAAASGETEVVSTLLAYLGGEFDRGAFLGLRHGASLGVQVIGVGTDAGCFAGGAIALADAEQLQRVVQERRLFFGELAAEGGDGGLVKAMGGGVEAPTLLLPLTVVGQVVAVLCVNDLKGRLAAGVFELQRVAAMAELALEMLCIRKRIRLG